MTSTQRSSVSLRQLSHKMLAFLVSVLLISTLAAPFAPVTRALAENSSSKKSSITDEPELTEATAAIVTDAQGNVLWSKNPDQELSMASITKVMSAIVALDSGIDLDKPCEITAPDLEEGSQLAGLTSDDSPTLRQLLMMMLVYSANDAAYNIAVNVSGSEQAFVDQMNKKAEEIGMTHTHFQNPHGLDADGHHSTARDLALMGRYAREHYPFIASAVHTRSFTTTVGGEQRTFHSTDDLMDTYRGLLGIKTGAEDSGTAFLGASMRGNVTLYTCVLGCDTTQGRFDDTAILMNWAYRNFNRVAIQRTSQVIQIRPSEDNFLLSAVVRPSASTTYMAWPGSDAFTYQTSMLSPNYPVANNQLISTTTWSQGSTNVGTTISQARLTLWTVPAYNLFDLYSVAPYLFGRN